MSPIGLLIIVIIGNLVAKFIDEMISALLKDMAKKDEVKDD